MHLTIRHETTYSYDQPVPYGLQQLRVRPKSRPGQTVLEWSVEVEGGAQQLMFEDEHANSVDLVSFDPDQSQVTIRSFGTVDIEDQGGVIGKHRGHVPLWLFQRETDLTEAGPGVARLIHQLDTGGSDLDKLHALSTLILREIPYSTDQNSAELTAEQALKAKHGVCQDHAHVFVTAARSLGFPARYVSGYLMMDDRVDQDATHAWAEAHVDGLGWVGFDVSNGISPDARYVRVATGLDYHDAAPILGLRVGGGTETMKVALQVQQ